MAKWDDKRIEKLKEAVKKSSTMREVILNMGLKVIGSHYKTIKKYIEKCGIDISHFHYDMVTHLSRVRNKDRKIPTEDLFVSGGEYRGTKHLKKRILEDKLIEYRCAECEISTWRGKDLSLHLDHIDGDNTNDRLDNLRFLCPNCHSQTDTYCGKNNAKRNCCMDCNTRIDNDSKRCRSCAQKQPRASKIEWPPTQELILDCNQYGFEAVGRKLGVTGNAIRKRISEHPND